MKQSEPEKDSQTSPWRPAQYSNLIRYVPSGKYFARFRIKGKLIWKTLKTDRITVAQLRLADLEKEERAIGGDLPQASPMPRPPIFSGSMIYPRHTFRTRFDSLSLTVPPKNRQSRRSRI